MSRVTGRRAALLLSVALCSCGGTADRPDERVVAEVGGRPVTTAQIQGFLDTTLVQDPAAEQPPPRDLAKVKSRLFDDYLDGEILLREAERQGIAVSDVELTAYLGPEAAPGPEALLVARRDLTIQKLRESTVRAQLRIDDERVRRWLASHPPPEGSPEAGTLRTLRFASYPEAMRVREEIVGRKLSLEEAAAAYGADALSETELAIDLTAFPEHIARAVRALNVGQVSQPLPFESSVLLFLLDRPGGPADLEERRREQARKAIALDESQRISDELLQTLRRKTPVVRHEERLPFPYVAESATSQAQ
jgi:parvulin-like peptidyl-prolyl isomerase